MLNCPRLSSDILLPDSTCFKDLRVLCCTYKSPLKVSPGLNFISSLIKLSKNYVTEQTQSAKCCVLFRIRIDFSRRNFSKMSYEVNDSLKMCSQKLRLRKKTKEKIIPLKDNEVLWDSLMSKGFVVCHQQVWILVVAPFRSRSETRVLICWVVDANFQLSRAKIDCWPNLVSQAIRISFWSPAARPLSGSPGTPPCTPWRTSFLNTSSLRATAGYLGCRTNTASSAMVSRDGLQCALWRN